MSCLTSIQIAEIKAEIVILDTQIAAAETAYLVSLTNSEVEEYRFDPGAGSQRVSRRSPEEIGRELDKLKAQRNRLRRKLNGTSNVNMNLRRKSHRGGRYV